MGKLTDKVALVSGASRGIGRAIAVRLAADGVAVFVNYLQNEAGARETVALIERAGGSAIALQGDLSNVASINAFFARLDSAAAAARCRGFAMAGASSIFLRVLLGTAIRNTWCTRRQKPGSTRSPPVSPRA
jgi:NAD(P)-dependent dehydrogenase (short-subunit alcohol dehydrogenase family)